MSVSLPKRGATPRRALRAEPHGALRLAPQGRCAYLRAGQRVRQTAGLPAIVLPDVQRAVLSSGLRAGGGGLQALRHQCGLVGVVAM
eukprot:3508470-Pyramimonas_sp.AAC.1